MIRVEKDGDGRPGQNQGPVPLHYRTNHSQTERGFLNYYVDSDEKNLHKWVNKQHETFIIVARRTRNVKLYQMFGLVRSWFGLMFSSVPHHLQN